MEYDVTVGLEIHAQLITESKIFSGSGAVYGAGPNSRTDPVVLGMPGILPVLNKKAVEYILRMGLATKCRIEPYSRFSRKHYFYPDLPKGYQITQYEQPLCSDGYIEIQLENGNRKEIGITRIHLEEDAGKSIHDPAISGDDTLIDLNRCGVPLIEIVSEPDLKTPQEAYTFLSKIKQLVTYLEICDGNMEEGSLRCDANVSLRSSGTERASAKTELKNMNSFRNVERALAFEIDRQIGIIEGGGKIGHQTMFWDADKGSVRSMRSKEEAHDYRYFPDPDLVPLTISKEWIETIKRQLPELPDEKKKRFLKQYRIPAYDVEILTSTKELSEYYEAVAKETDDFKLASNWMMGEVQNVLKERGIEMSQFPLSAENISSLLNLVTDQTISQKIAKVVFWEMLENRKSARSIVEEKKLAQITDVKRIDDIISKVLKNNRKQVDEYKAGKTKVFGFLVGQVMKLTKGKANPSIVNEILTKKLNE